MTELPQHFLDALSVLSEPQKILCKQLYAECGQAHLFDERNFNKDSPPSMRRQLAAQLDALDQEYIAGGLHGYIANAKLLLADSRNGVNPLDGWKPMVPIGEAFTLGTNSYKETEALGMKELGRVGFVLVAGGLGERLGYSSIKIGLPTEMTTKTCYLQFYIEYILAVQKKFGQGRKLSLCIMTSGDTNAKTIELLQKNSYFGMQSDQVTIVQQGQGVPALLDNNASIALESKDKWYKVQTKPHGHGDIHQLLHAHGVAKRWKESGIQWLTLFQDTNGLAFHTLPLMLGVSRKLNLIMNSLTVPRKAKQAVGGIVKLKNKKTGDFRTVNVEYNQLDPLLRASGFPDGDVNDPETGHSPFPGNINQLVFQLENYVQILDRSLGLMPEFVNPKYSDDTKTTFKKPTRLECMMQDFPTVLNSTECQRVGFTSVTADLCFSPVKNATEDGVKLQEQGTQPGTAATGEADQYGAWCKILNSIGVNVETAKDETYLGITVKPGPAIIIKPDFACCPGELESRFPLPTAVTISARSTLFIRGSNIIIESLNLDGALIIDYGDEKVTIKDLTVQNSGFVRVPVTDTEDEVIQMRGYRIEQKQIHRMEKDQGFCTIA